MIMDRGAGRVPKVGVLATARLLVGVRAMGSTLTLATQPAPFTLLVNSHSLARPDAELFSQK